MTSEKSLKDKSIGGFVWKLFEKIGSQLVAMIIQIALARLLMPEDYGIIGYLTLFISITDVFLKQGFTTALIQKREVDEIDNSTVFYANISMSIILYLIMFFIAPLVSDYYREPRLINIMRILSLTVLIGSLSAVHEAIMAKNLEFKKSFIRGLANTITNGVVGIVLAVSGAGVWSLVYGRLAGAIVGMIVLWITVKWYPKLIFSYSRLKKLFRFSSGVLGTNLLETFFHNIHALIIGRMYSSSDLGYYQRGQNIPQTIMGSIDGSMTEVMYPTFSALQDNTEKLKDALRRAMKLSMFVCMPIMVGLFVTAKSLTIILLTEKWLASVPYMKIMCVVTMFWPLASRIHALKAIGRSGLTFKISLFNNSIYLCITFVLSPFGPEYIMVAAIISNLMGMIITSYYVKKYLSYSLMELASDIGRIVLLVAFMGTIVYLVTLLRLNIWVELFSQVLLGIFIYVVGAKILRIDSFEYIQNIIRKKWGSINGAN